MGGGLNVKRHRSRLDPISASIRHYQSMTLEVDDNYRIIMIMMIIMTTIPREGFTHLALLLVFSFEQ